MADPDSSGTTAKVKYKLSDYLQWEMFYDIVNDTAKDHEIWEFVDPDATSDDANTLIPTSPLKPTTPTPPQGSTEVSRIYVEEYVQSLREYDRKKAALRKLKLWIKDSIDTTASVFVQNKDTIREMLQALKANYAKSDAELKVELDREFVKLKRAPHSKDLETWIAQWNQFHTKAKKYERTEYLGYNVAIEFLRASQAVAPTFAMTTYAKIIDLFQSGGDIPDIPSLTRRLQLELRINSTLTPSSGSKPTAFATLQGLDTDDPAPAPAPAQPAPKPSGNGNKGLKANNNKDLKQRKCLCGEVHHYADCPYLIPSN